MGTVVNGQLWTQFISLADYLLLPFYLIILYFFANRFRNRRYPPSHPWRVYFLGGFTVKILGALFIGLIYQYYYSGGDTSAFFYHANVINSALNESMFKWINLILGIPNAYDGAYIEYTSQMMWYGVYNSYIICSITAIINLLTFNTFLPTSIIFAALSFSGNWAMFRIFAKQYPQHIHAIATATLFIPSTFVWGSGIFKDTICISALGWLTYSTFRLLVQHKLNIKNITTIIICIYLLSIIKIYILLAFMPALALWISFIYTHRVEHPFTRAVVKWGVTVFCISGLLFLFVSFTESLGRYSLDNIIQTSNITRSYIFQISQTADASAYDLGDFDPTVLSMLKKLPLSVNVTLFRPYIWEARKPVVLLNALEATLFLFFTLKVLISIGPVKTWRIIRKDPNIQFFLIFTIIFSFAVGISSYNFGALSRYRIPCLPFYAMALALIYYHYKPTENRFFSLNFR